MCAANACSNHPLTQQPKEKIIPPTRRGRRQGGRHQIGTPAGFGSEQVAGFGSEQVAGFRLEYRAGFVEIRDQLHLALSGARTPKINGTVSALRYFFDVTLVPRPPEYVIRGPASETLHTSGRHLDCGSGCMNDDIEVLVGTWRDK